MNKNLFHTKIIQNSIKAFKLNSLKSKILVVTLLIVLILIGSAGVYFYTFTSRVLTNNVYTEISQQSNQIITLLNSHTQSLDSVYMSIISNPQIRTHTEFDNSTLNTDLTFDYQQSLRRQTIEEQLTYLMIYNPLWNSKLIRSVYLFKSPEENYCISRDNTNVNIKNNRVKSLYKSLDTQIEGSQFFPSADIESGILYYAKNFRNQNTLEFIGTVIIGIDSHTFSQVYRNSMPFSGAHAYMLMQDGTVLADLNNNMMGQKIDSQIMEFLKSVDADKYGFTEYDYNGTVYLTAAQSVGNYGWNSLIMIPKYEVLSELHSSMYIYILLTIIVLIALLYFSIVASTYVTKPLYDLSEHLKAVKSGNYTVKMPRYKDIEIDNLAIVYNDMADEIDRLISDIYQKQLLIKEAEIKSLQAQINPHFLFNVLDTVSWFAQAGRTDDISKIINSLGQILRANLFYSNQETITIGQELNYVKLYISIQKYRFENRLNFDLQIHDNLILNCSIPKLCLQPIVENAIVHGIEEKVGVGHLKLTVETVGEDILFTVSDDGVGFDIQWLDNIRKNSEANTHNSKHTNIGIINSDKRIKILYGNQYGISIQSKINVGTTVNIKIPKIKKE